MKNKLPWKAILLLLVAFILCGVAIAVNSVRATSGPAYTIYSTDTDGTSVLYDTWKTMGYSVGLSFAQVDATTPIDDVMVVIQPHFQYFTDEDEEALLAWVEVGGKLLYFDNSSSFEDAYLEDFIEEDSYGNTLYQYGEGQVLVGRSDDLLNSTLIEDSGSAESVHQTMNKWTFKHILFHEYVHGYKQSPSFFRMLPTGVKMVVYQLGLLTIVAVWFLGKRFGNPIPHYEEVEREENAYVQTLAVIFKNAGRGEVAIDNLYEQFLQDCADYFGVTLEDARTQVVELWQNNHLPDVEKLEALCKHIQQGQPLNTKNRKVQKQLMVMVNTINQLTAHLKEHGYE